MHSSLWPHGRASINPRCTSRCLLQEPTLDSRAQMHGHGVTPHLGRSIPQTRPGTQKNQKKRKPEKVGVFSGVFDGVRRVRWVEVSCEPGADDNAASAFGARVLAREAPTNLRGAFANPLKLPTLDAPSAFCQPASDASVVLTPCEPAESPCRPPLDQT